MPKHPNDAARIAAQDDALSKLAEPLHDRRLLLEDVVRRPRTALEPFDAQQPQRRRRRRVAVSLLRSADRRSIPAVEGEFLVAVNDLSPSVTADLAKLGFRPASERHRDAVRFEAVDDGPRFNLDGALQAARDQGIPLSSNHVVALSVRMKGETTPEYTDNPLSGMPAPERRSGALVVVIDTGIDQHAGARTDGWLDGVVPLDNDADVDPLDLVSTSGDLTPDGLLDDGAGHGTFIAGIVRQVDPGAQVIMLRALDTDGLSHEAEIADAIHRAADVFAEHGGRGVLNLSFGFETVDETPPPIIAAALAALPDDVIVVAAAGNSGTTVRMWPAAFDDVCAVAALKRSTADLRRLEPTKWSNHGDWVDFSTLGTGVISTFVPGTESADWDDVPEVFPRNDAAAQDQSYALWSGTSFAAPQVAGWLARYLAEHPEAPTSDAKQALRAEGAAMDGFGVGVTILEWPPV